MRAAIFLVFLGLWTWKLLEPQPVPEELQAGLDEAGLSFFAAKCLHAAGYAFLTAFAFILPVPRRWSWCIVAFLALHGVGTEIGQTFVPNRTGRVRDVAIDWLGIGLGLAAVHGWRRYCVAESARRR
jgi:VanZ family protein